MQPRKAFVNAAKHAGNGCCSNSIMKDPPHTRGDIANLHWSHASCIGIVSMNSFILVFVPDRAARGDFEAALGKHVDSAEFIEAPIASHSETIEDMEQLPLWRWFTF